MKTKIIPFGNAPNAVPRVTVNSKASGQASLKNQKQEEKKGDNYGRYKGWSMSNNAVAAYEDGEMPISKWSKKVIIERIEEAIDAKEIELQCSLEELKKLPLKVLRDNCLTYTSWHHTSKFFNQTNFYSLDISYIEQLTDEDVKGLLSAHKKGKDGGTTSEIVTVSQIDKDFWKKTIHDGISPITVPKECNDDEAFTILWKNLVPYLGRARTAQGEVIRIAGKVDYENYNNCCDNWDEDFNKMLDAFPKYLQLGNGFDKKKAKAAENLARRVKEQGAGGCIHPSLTEALCNYAVAWVRQNPEVIAPLEADYIR